MGTFHEGKKADQYALNLVLLKFMEHENFSTNDESELTTYFLKKIKIINKFYILSERNSRAPHSKVPFIRRPDPRALLEGLGFIRSLAVDEIKKRTEIFKQELNLINTAEIISEIYMKNSSVLKDVLLTKRGSKDCIELIMEDGTKRARNFGDLNEIFSVVSKLKGLRIYNDVANPKSNSDYEWFLNINIDERKHVAPKDEEDDIPF